MVHMTDAQVLATHDFRPLADPDCGLAGPYGSAGEARAALETAGFRLGDWGGGHDATGRYGAVVVIDHPTERRDVAYAAEVDWPAGDELE